MNLFIYQVGGTNHKNLIRGYQYRRSIGWRDSLRMLDCDGSYFIFTIVRNPFVEFVALG